MKKTDDQVPGCESVSAPTAIATPSHKFPTPDFPPSIGEFATDEERRKLDAEADGRSWCANCRFWSPCEPRRYHLDHATVAVDQSGTCRRRSPMDISELWPTTHFDDWCGEFERFHS